jgi:adenine deaminase
MGIIIKNVNLIDVMNGTVENSKNILIEKDRIKDIFDDFEGFDTANHKVYDYSGKYVIPGNL